MDPGAIADLAGNPFAGSSSNWIGIGFTTQTTNTSAWNVAGTGAPADPYLAWAGEGVLFGDDANDDGVSNGLAFLLGADSPTSAVTLPSVNQTNGNLTLTFSMLDAAARGDATLAIEHSSDLGVADPWTTVPVPDTTGTVDDVAFTVTDSGPLNAVTATIASAAAAGRLFARRKGDN